MPGKCSNTELHSHFWLLIFIFRNEKYLVKKMFFWDRISLYGPIWVGVCYADQAGLEFEAALLHLPSAYWNYRHVPHVPGKITSKIFWAYMCICVCKCKHKCSIVQMWISEDRQPFLLPYLRQCLCHFLAIYGGLAGPWTSVSSFHSPVEALGL